MEEAIKKYAKKIQDNKVNPVFPCADKTGLIIDSQKEDVPLVMLNFGKWNLSAGEAVVMNTQDREVVIVPMEGSYKVSVGGNIYEGSRIGGPFNINPGESNACAVYIPGDESFKIEGDGEFIWYSAPTTGGTKPVHILQDSKPNLSRGSLTWRRDVITLIEPGIESTNLVVGETYSPPALWSGTPLHIHDKDDIKNGQSDHEEIYYHTMRLSKTQGRDAPYTIQMLFDGKTLDKAYIMRDKYAFAIPGASHPVVASPISDSLYVWALAGKEGDLGMWDIPEFSYLKKVGEFIESQETKRGTTKVSKIEIEEFCKINKLDKVAESVFRLNLIERGFEID